jgi:ubiquitin-like modifier-activating enzyme ATG7
VQQIWDAINDETIYSCPSLLASFISLSFADLKKYKFSYWFGFPALHSDPSWKKASNESGEEPEALTGIETTALVDSVQTWRYSVDPRQHGFFLAKKVKPFHNFGARRQTNEDVDDQDPDQRRMRTPETPVHSLGFTWSVSSLSSYENGFFDGMDPEDCFVCFADPSNYEKNPGWMLRNLLVLVRQRFKLDKVQILCYRDVHNRRDGARSFILNLQSGPIKAEGTSLDMPKVTGWERNPAGKLAGRLANLGENMMPER